MPEEFKLPKPKHSSSFPLEEAIFQRQSIRNFSSRSLTLEQLSQLLWAAQGVSEKSYRTAPSAGATYPLELFVVVGKGGVDSLKVGIYHYQPANHSLLLLSPEELRKSLASACLGQNFIQKSPLSLVISAKYTRTTSRYGERGIRYTHMEVGHAGQNISLQAVALGLGTVMVGAFYDQEVSRVLNLPEGVEPLYIIPVGYPFS